MGEDDYWKLVSDSAAAVKGLESASEASIQTTCQELAGRWEMVKQVQLKSGKTVVLDSGILVEALKAKSPDLKAIAALLGQLQSAHQSEQPASITSKDTAALAEILQKSEFNWNQPEPTGIQKFFQDLLAKVRAWLDGILPHGIVIDMRLITTVAVFTALLLVLYFGFRDGLREFTAEASLREGPAGEELLDATGALQRAQHFSQSGDRRLGVRYLYLSALLLLEERGLLRYDRSLTNREYVRSIHNHPDLARILRDVIDVFDRVWYGFEPIDAVTYEHYTAQVESLKEQK